jgi:uncharacterized RDD family membrane protein YckC
LNSPQSFSPIDTTIEVTTPENVAFHFRVAGPFPRLIAFLIDLLLLLVALYAVGVICFMLGLSAVGLFLMFAFFTWWGTGGVLEALCNGQTVGKRALGIRVVSDSGLSINAGQAMLRNILRAADLVPPFFPGVIAMFFNRRFQRLGDLAAQTMVVFDGDNVMPQIPHTDRMTEEFHSRIPPRYRPDPALVEALAAYVGRRQDLTVPLRREVADHLSRHFVRMWNLPAKSDPDFVLCALYEYATRDLARETRASREPRAAQLQDQFAVVDV